MPVQKGKELTDAQANKATWIFFGIIGLLILGGIVHAIVVGAPPSAPKQTCAQSVSDPRRDLSADASENDQSAAYDQYSMALALCYQNNPDDPGNHSTP